MKRGCERSMALVLAAVLLLGLAVSPAHAGIRLMGSVGANGYAYNDAQNENHFWLQQSTRLSLYQTGGPLSVHFSGGYLGDNADDFSTSGEARFYKGYIQYSKLGSALTGRAGRFFLYDGVALGVLDGAQVGYRINRMIGVKLFAGLMGPMNRLFEFEDPAKAMSFGGRIDISPANCLIADKGRMAVSFTSQQREEIGLTRQLVGLHTYHTWMTGASWFNTVHLRPGGTMLRKWMSRARYLTHDWNTLAELGIYTPNVADESWFNGFSTSTSIRLRFAVDRMLVAERWGVGLEGAYLTAGGKGGYRAGPVVTTPVGQVGYRMSGGDRAISSGPWVSLRYAPMHGVEMYAYGQMVSYEWDAFDIENDELTMVHAGLRYTPAQLPSVTLSGEYQIYQTPQFDNDRRGLGGLTWRFDTGRTR
ncbi:hypothetical protein KQI63_09965 [bacterium]|nr:hypothetical protein [bacterium]